MRKNKVYLYGAYYLGGNYGGSTVSARGRLDLPQHVGQVELIAVASTKAEVGRMLAAHYGSEVPPSTLRGFIVNDGFSTWRRLSEQGVLSIERPGVWVTEMNPSTLVALLPDKQSAVVARGRRDTDRSGPLGKLVWTPEQAG